MSLAFIFNGIDFANFGVVVAKGVKIPGGYGRPLDVKGMPATNTVWFSRGKSQAVNLVFPCRIKAETKEILFRYLDNIKTALLTNAPAPLYHWYTDRYHMAMWDGIPLSFSVLGGLGLGCVVRCDIGFLAQPDMVGNVTVSGTMIIESNPATLWLPGPLEGSGVVSGTVQTNCAYEIVNLDESEITEGALEIWNYTTGHVLYFAGSLAAGAHLKIDRATGTAETSANGNPPWTDVSDQISGNEDWLALQPGVANRFDVIGMVDGTIDWVYTPRYA